MCENILKYIKPHFKTSKQNLSKIIKTHLIMHKKMHPWAQNTIQIQVLRNLNRLRTGFLLGFLYFYWIKLSFFGIRFDAFKCNYIFSNICKYYWIWFDAYEYVFIIFRYVFKHFITFLSFFISCIFMLLNAFFLYLIAISCVWNRNHYCKGNFLFLNILKLCWMNYTCYFILCFAFKCVFVVILNIWKTYTFFIRYFKIFEFFEKHCVVFCL